MVKPWGATNSGRRPSESELRELVQQGLSDGQISEQFGVTSGAVLKWRRAATPPIKSPVKRRAPLSHAEHLPWALAPKDVFDPLAVKLRLWSRLQQAPDTLKAAERRQAEDLAATLAEFESVLDYTPERGFFRRRRLLTDDPNKLVRMPA